MRWFSIALILVLSADLHANHPKVPTQSDNLAYNELQLREMIARNQERLNAWGDPTIDLSVCPDPSGGEAFSISTRPDHSIRIVGGGNAGLGYGIQELEQLLQANPSRPEQIEIMEKPDFELRGNALFLMKDGGYNYELTPEEFPFFYDRELMTRYLDYLHACRFNTIFIWTGHLFPSIVEMPEYPEATDLTRDQLLRNQAQFRWFTDECAQRNISVLLHFYNIHIAKAMAKARNIPIEYNQPNEFVTRYMRYALDRFLSEFKSVGLYVCPGEAMNPRYAPEWVRDVILASAKACGHRPRVVVRTWSFDKDVFERTCGREYDNLYLEGKHNIEMVVSPTPAPGYEDWIGLNSKYVINLHELADLKPFRWGSPRFVHEMVSAWKKAGFYGAEVYSMVSWRWPYTLDKLEPRQKGYWPVGKKLLTFERDWIWLEAVGRYLWKVDRDPAQEAAYWDNRLAKRFGNREAAQTLRRWYDTTGPILPGLENLMGLWDMNWHPIANGEQMLVDNIINGREIGYKILIGATPYPHLPVDAYFLERYKQRFDCPDLRDRVSMPVYVYTNHLASGDDVSGKMTPDNMSRLFVEMAEESLALAYKAAEQVTLNREEAQRFVADSEALVYISRIARHKIMATISKYVYLLSGNETHLDSAVTNLDDSVSGYERLLELTGRTYLAATDMNLGYNLNWPEMFVRFQEDRKNNSRERLIRMRETREKAPALKNDSSLYWIEAMQMEGNWPWRYAGGSLAERCRCPHRGPPPLTSLGENVEIKEAGSYTVWVHALIGGVENGEIHRALSMKINGRVMATTHQETDPINNYFVWHRAGTIDLSAGNARVEVEDAGSAQSCLDVIVLHKNPAWKPTAGTVGDE